jgi:hypothetical protein
LEILKGKSNTIAMKLTSAKGQLKLAQDTPPFTTVLPLGGKADNFQITKRDWESFWGFYCCTKTFHSTKAWRLIYAAFASANTVKHREKSIELGEEYLKNKEWKKFRADVTFIMANAYRQEAESLQNIAISLQSAMGTAERDQAEKAKINLLNITIVFCIVR